MKYLSLKPKRWLVTFHLIFAAILFGITVGFLVLSITAAATKDGTILKGCYSSMYILSTTSLRVSTIGTVVTGIALSIWTKWGLFKFYWIIVKEVLTLISIGLGLIGMLIWTREAFHISAGAGMAAMENSDFLVNRLQLFFGIILQIISLAVMMILSVFKPWGQRKRAD
ncbi:hypothetical protein MUN89_04045 [Halobacillus salinarum]|uniref:DUF2269 family protein n=1 Tax=Halobacillus salinarum TaxID=2932257 RepID=A0ABY4ENE6_9BACI|nr:hypothetical protein [Halobacillus salinarum]UOQ45137.1 hypothetical protein MUN89_04045 [Halobacillus salinarum]